VSILWNILSNRANTPTKIGGMIRPFWRKKNSFWEKKILMIFASVWLQWILIAWPWVVNSFVLILFYADLFILLYMMYICTSADHKKSGMNTVIDYDTVSYFIWWHFFVVTWHYLHPPVRRCKNRNITSKIKWKTCLLIIFEIVFVSLVNHELVGNRPYALRQILGIPFRRHCLVLENKNEAITFIGCISQDLSSMHRPYVLKTNLIIKNTLHF